jgi:hypothetical protein
MIVSMTSNLMALGMDFLDQMWELFGNPAEAEKSSRYRVIAFPGLVGMMLF